MKKSPSVKQKCCFLDLFGKAKEKILKTDNVKKEERPVWEPQELGIYSFKITHSIMIFTFFAFLLHY